MSRPRILKGIERSGLRLHLVSPEFKQRRAGLQSGIAMADVGVQKIVSSGWASSCLECQRETSARSLDEIHIMAAVVSRMHSTVGLRPPFITATAIYSGRRYFTCWDWSTLDFDQQHPCVQQCYQIREADCSNQPIQTPTGSHKKGYSSDQVWHEG
jgi:hypothetical protein